MAALAFVILMLVYTGFREWIFWAVGLIFLFFSFLKLAEGISRLLQPTRSVIVIDRLEGKLVAKYPFAKKREVFLADIIKIQLNGVREKLTNRRDRLYAEIKVMDRYGGLHTILSINPTRIVSSYEGKTEKELQETGFALAKFLAEETRSEFQWMGFRPSD